MPSRGSDFYRLMADQSRRAADFDRRMRWIWLRWLLIERTPDELPTGPPVPDGTPTIDLRPSVARAVPRQRD